MNKIAKLEKRWKIYRAKKFVSVLLFSSMFYIVGAGGYYTFLNWSFVTGLFSKEIHLEESNRSTVQEQSMVFQKELKKDTNISIKKEILEPTEAVVEELSLKPVIPIIDMEKEKAHRSKSIVHKKKARTNRVVKAKPSTYLTAQELSGVRKSNERDTTTLKKIHLHSSSNNYIATMKKKFSRSKNSRDALLLAKAFYREQNYKESERWALEANKLDSNLDESWIVFAQAKAKLGKKSEAINILAMYYKRTKSLKVKAVLEKIKMRKL